MSIFQESSGIIGLNSAERTALGLIFSCIRVKNNCCVFEQNVKYFSTFFWLFSVLLVTRQKIMQTYYHTVSTHISNDMSGALRSANRRPILSEVSVKYQQSIGEVVARYQWTQPSVDPLSTEWRPSVDRLSPDAQLIYGLAIDWHFTDILTVIAVKTTYSKPDPANLVYFV